MKYKPPRLLAGDQSKKLCFCSSGSSATGSVAVFPICQNGGNVDSLPPVIGTSECSTGNNPTWTNIATCTNGNNDTISTSYCKNGSTNGGATYPACGTGNGVV